jgi:O-antigen/teichoic acid export membrane protein
MRLHKQIYIYFSSYFINAILSFVILSLLTHYLTTYDYGVINLYSSFLIFLMPFISGGILYPLSVEYFKRPRETYSAFFTDANAISLVSLTLFTILCIIFQHPLSRFLKVSEIWIWIMPATAWWIMINETAMMITRNNNKPFQFALFSVGKNLAEMAMTVVLVIGLHWAWQGRLLSATLAPVLTGIISIYLFFRWRLVATKIVWSNTRRIFLLSLPFVFERLSVFVLGYSDKYFIDRFDLNGTKEVGLYGLGSQLATVIFLVIVSMNSAYQPHLFKKLSDGFKGKIHKTTVWYIAACAVTVAGMFIAIPLLFRFFIGSRFQDAKPYAYILCSGYFMWGVYNAFLAYLIYLEKNRQILFISIIGMIASLSLNILMVTRYGAQGAAIASVITYSLMAITCYLLVRKYFLEKNEKLFLNQTTNQK